MEINDRGGSARLRPVTPLSIIAERLGLLLLQAQATPALDPTFLRTLAETAELARGLDPYLQACTTPESTALTQLVADTNQEPWTEHYVRRETSLALEAEMLSGHVEGQLLRTLVYAMRARRILEIGLFTGYSALAMAEALPADGRLIACEIDRFAAEVAQRAFARSPHHGKITVEIGAALASMQRLADAGERFDLIFIDADKANYVNYLRLILESTLLEERGLICVDNTLMQGQPYLTTASTPIGAAIAEFNRVVRDDSRVEQVLLPLRDGLTLIRRI